MGQPTLESVRNSLQELLKLGQSVWYDGLVTPQEFSSMIAADGIRGATTNPSIFQKALSEGALSPNLAEFLKSHSEEESYQKIAVDAVREVADAFLPLFERTKGQDGFISLEVSPLLAYDTEKTIAEAKELFRQVGRKNVMIKIPATKEGIPAIEAVIAEGINVNVTLIFSVQRYREVMEAYLLGLEKRVLANQPIDFIASVASFFVSRVDTATDQIIAEKIKTAQSDAERDLLSSILGKTAIANSKIAYDEFEKVISDARFEALKNKGAQYQRPLWASTGTKNPKYSDVVYVESLIGPFTVNTVPPPTLSAFKDHGCVKNTLKTDLPEALKVFEKLKEADICLEEVTERLEKVGVSLFEEAYKKILQLIEHKRKSL